LIFCHTGVGVEGILRQSADVEDVERRVRDYEQGDNFLTMLFLLKLDLLDFFSYSLVYLVCCVFTLTTSLAKLALHHCFITKQGVTSFYLMKMHM
jgi:hypothetical protein